MAPSIYVGDRGTVIKADCVVNISDATVHTLKVKKPNGTLETWTGTIVDNTIIEHITGSSDLDQVGVYSVQAYIETPSGKWHGNAFEFTVLELYNCAENGTSNSCC